MKQVFGNEQASVLALYREVAESGPSRATVDAVHADANAEHDTHIHKLQRLVNRRV